MQMVEICKEFGWTYKQFEETPMEFITLIREKMKIDTQKANNEAKRHK